MKSEYDQDEEKEKIHYTIELFKTLSRPKRKFFLLLCRWFLVKRFIGEIPLRYVYWEWRH
jgi:hypothetical protein